MWPVSARRTGDRAGAERLAPRRRRSSLTFNSRPSLATAVATALPLLSKTGSVVAGPPGTSARTRHWEARRIVEPANRRYPSPVEGALTRG